MPLGPKKLLELVKEQELVKDLSERELTNPEGTGFDLRVAEFHTLKQDGEAYIGIKERQTPETETVAAYDPQKGDEQEVYTIQPGQYVLMKTIESVNIPTDLVSFNYSRSTTFRSGLILACTQAAPGYSGPLTFGLYNAGGVPVKIQLGARLTHVQFETVNGEGSAYRGQWQGGRIAAVKKEVQV